MKKFHFSRGVFYRFRPSVIIVALLVCGQVFALQHYYLLSRQVSAEVVDTAFLLKLKNQRTTPSVQTARLLFMGDTMLARGIGSAIESGRNPYEHVTTLLKEHDLRVANIETTIADPVYENAASKPYTFNAPLSSLQLLEKMDIDVSSLANNHTGDFGRMATKNMLDQFKSQNLTIVGAGESVAEAFSPVFKSVDGIKIAFIAVNDIELAHTKVSEGVVGSAYLDKDLIAQSITHAKQNGADVVVVMPHWGIEYSLKESSRQQEWGRYMIDSGADVVIGGHPHVIQPTEQYKNGYIVYSLGNFIFDGMSGEARRGQMVSLSVEKTTNNINESSSNFSIRSIPFTIDDSGFPQP